ncbi:MAG: putative bifunctional diguanylate cyclase/phosphodiesterase [Solirubrobacteraceae bacterium]
MVATVRWVGPARAAMFVILTGVIIGSAPDTGWYALIPLAVCAVGSIALYRNLEQRRRPEFWAAGGWLVTQTTLGIGIALTGGPHSPALPWLAVAVISLVARFSRAGIVAGLMFLFGVLVAVTFGMDPVGVWHHPSEFLVPVGLLFSVGVFAAAQMRSDLDHRDYDKVTGLPNQAKFGEDLRLAMLRRVRRGGAVSVLAVDLDGFRLANDGLGPKAGDALLRQAGGRIVRAARSADLVARRSADEFLIFLSDLGGEHGAHGATPMSTPEQLAQAVARAVQAEIAQPFMIGDEEVYLDACVGISVLGSGVEEAAPAAERLLTEAQSALTAARSAGPGTLLFFDHDHSASRSQLSLISRLRKAIDREQFVMHYQPSVNLHTGQLIGVEALIRWEDPDRGMVPPGEFIGLAEETGLIEAIGGWGFAEVCRQARDWQCQGHHFDVAFNLSPRQLHQPDLLERMFKTIDATGVDPKTLIIEITESTALRDPDRAIALMEQMTQHGLRLAIDDFGIGLSSLSRLREMPAEFLKLDRSFVADLETSPSGVVMVRTIVQLAENLGMCPHAEGIETEQQRRILMENGCSQGQGFLFSRGVPADEVLRFDFRSRQAALMPTGRAPRRVTVPRVGASV